MEKSLTAESEKKILEKTPSKYVKFRPGSGGMQFAYVETGYVIKRLNEVFNYLWDFKIVREQVGKKQVWVAGELTIHLSPELTITKSNYGGADIKYKVGTEETVDIGNDLKAASADCLKKCASMLGMFEDVYWKDSDLNDKVKVPSGQNPPEPF